MQMSLCALFCTLYHSDNIYRLNTVFISQSVWLDFPKTSLTELIVHKYLYAHTFFAIKSILSLSHCVTQERVFHMCPPPMQDFDRMIFQQQIGLRIAIFNKECPIVVAQRGAKNDV